MEDEKNERHRRGRLEGGGGRGKESALYEVVCPAFYVVRIFGLGPYDFPRDNMPPRLRPSRFNCIYALFWISVYSLIVTTSLIRFGHEDEDKPILGVTEKGKLILNYIVAVLDIMIGIFTRAKFVQVWNAIQDFDIVFDLDDPERKPHSVVKLWLWSILFTSFVSWTAINQLGMWAFSETYLRNIGYMLIYVGTFVAVFKFAGVVFILGQRFAYLNAYLVNLIRRAVFLQRQQQQHPPPPPIFSNSNNSFIVKKVEDSYNHLMNTSELFGELYSWSLMLFLMNLFAHTVCNMYFFYYWTIINPMEFITVKIIIVEFLWLMVYLIQLLVIHISCDFASLQAYLVTNHLFQLHRRQRRLLEPPLPDFKSTLHFLNRKLNFTAAGCFNVNLRSLTTTFGHLTTYLVILLQLSSSTSNNEDS